MWLCIKRLLQTAAYLCGLLVFIEFCLEYKTYNSPRYELEVDYLHWTSSLPAFSFCQANFTTDFRATPLDRFLKNLVRPQTTYCLGCDSPHAKHFPTDNYTHIISNASGPKCNAAIRHAVHITSRPAYQSAIQISGETSSSIDKIVLFYLCTVTEHKYVVSHFAKDADLEIVLSAPVQVFMHDPKDVDFVNATSPVVRDNYTLQILYLSKELKEDETAWILTERQRGCVLRRERNLKNHPFFYSKSACRTEKRIARQMKLCNCTHHLLPNHENRTECNLDGLQCLDAHFSNRMKNKREANKKRKKDFCPHACEEVEINVIWSSLRRYEIVSRNEDTGGILRVQIKLSSPPRERLTLKSRVDNLDILIGVACFSRFFTSKSVMGILTRLLLLYCHHNRKEDLTYHQILY